MVASLAEGCRVNSLMGGSILPMRVEGVTGHLDPPSLTPLSEAGCDRVQLGVPHWATSVVTAS